MVVDQCVFAKLPLLGVPRYQNRTARRGSAAGTKVLVSAFLYQLGNLPGLTELATSTRLADVRALRFCLAR